MSKINRFDGNYKAFASEQQTNERTTFGTETISDDLTAQQTPEYLRGMGIVGPSQFPTLQDFNAVNYSVSQTLSYLHQMGIAEWNATQEYPTEGAACLHNGVQWYRKSTWTLGDEPGVSDSWRSDVIVLSSVFDPRFADLVEGQSVEIVEYHPDSGVGGGRGVVRTARHNGGTAISLTRTRPTDWTNQTQLTAWFADSGSDELCFVRATEELYADHFGAKGDGTTDDWNSINKALQTYRVVNLNSLKTYAVSKMVELRQNQHLKLGADTTLLMPSALTSTNDPVVWLLAPFASLRGKGSRSSYIKKNYRSRDGIVKLGAQSMTTQSNAVFQCVVEGFEMVGEKAYGQVSGDPDIGLHMPSPELGGFFNYFHVLRDLAVRNVNIGYWFRGWANGIFGSNLYGVNVGNTSIQSCLILHQGCLDNMIHDVFFNQSNDVTGVIVEDLDNTLNGSPSVMQTQHNTYRGIVCEQGGTTEVAFDIRASRSSYFEVRDNVTIGNLLFAGFQDDNNTFFSSRTVILPLDTSTKQLEATSRFNVQRAAPGDSSQEGATIGDGVTNSVTADNDIVMLFNRINGGGRINDYRIGGVNVGQVYSNGAGIISFTNPNYGLQFRDTFIGPTDSTGNIVSNQLDLGVSSGRFKTGFFVNSPDVSSDRNLKTDEQDAPLWLREAALEIKSSVKIWRWLHKVESDSEGEGENARYHVGPMAQDVVSILENHAPDDTDIYSFGIVSKYIDENEVERLSIRPTEILWLIISTI